MCNLSALPQQQLLVYEAATLATPQPTTKTDPVTFRRVLARAVLLPLILLALLTGLFLFQINRLLNTVGWVEHTDQVIAIADKSQKLLLDMETGFRGFAITAKPEFLDPYHSGLQDIGPTLRQLRQLVQDNPSQLQRMDHIEQLYSQWSKYAEEVITDITRGREAQARVSSGEGKRMMDALRVQFAGFLTEEEKLRHDRTAAARSATNWAVGSGLASALVLGCVLAVFIRREILVASDTYRKALVGEQLHREWLQTTLTSIGDAVIATDDSGNINLMNGVAESITGWKQDEARGIPLEKVFKIINEETRATVESPVVKVLREGQIVGLANHTILIARDGSETPIDDSGAPIKDAEGNVAGVVLVFRDITERKLTEVERDKLLEREKALRTEAEIANRLKDEFFSNASHELRTPLTAIVGWIRMLRRGNLDESTREAALETIERNASAQTKLIDDLLDISRIIAGKLDVDMQPIEVEPLVNSAVNSIRPAAEAKLITIDIQEESKSWPVLGDVNRLQQVVWNLLSNAVKFTPQGGSINVKMKRVESFLEISVTDTGEGIEPRFLPYVFDRFRQADGSKTRKHGGLGLGLSIVRNLVELQGGTVSAFSEGRDKGAKFTVRLPLFGVSNDDQVQSIELWKKSRTEGQLIECPPRLQGVKVLVVDDDRDTRTMLDAVLRQCDAEVTTAASTNEAIERFNAQRPDVLVSDIGMPEYDGYELIRRIRKREAEQGVKGVPALALTAFAKSEDRVRALTSGYHVHLSKPVDPEEFALIVSSLAGRES